MTEAKSTFKFEKLEVWQLASAFSRLGYPLADRDNRVSTHY